MSYLSNEFFFFFNFSCSLSQKQKKFKIEHLGAAADDKSEPQKKVVHSNYMLTFNKNIAIPEPEVLDREKKQLQEKIKKIFTQDFIYDIVVFREQREVGDNSDKVWVSTNKKFFDLVEDVVVKTVVEVGTQKSLLHAHILIAITHRTNLQINMELIKNTLAQENTGIKYASYKLYHDALANIENYISKQFRAAEAPKKKGGSGFLGLPQAND